MEIMDQRLREGSESILPLQKCQENITPVALTPIGRTATSQGAQIQPTNFHLKGQLPRLGSLVPSQVMNTPADHDANPKHQQLISFTIIN